MIKRKFLSMFVAIMMLCSITINSQIINVNATSKTADEAINWVKSKVGKKVGTGQCVSLICYYYDFLGVSRVPGNAKDYATNALPSGWSRIKGAVPQKGDILVYSAGPGGSYGHVAIAESANISYHQNYNNVQIVQKKTFAYNSPNYINNYTPYWGVIRPNFSSGSTAKPSITNVKVTAISRDGYTVSCTVTGGNKINRVQFPTWTVYKGQDDLASNWSTNTSIRGSQSGNTWTFRVKASDHNNEEGYYSTHIYAYDNAGNVASYQPGSPSAYVDRTNPTVSNIKISNVSESGYTVSCTATDRSGIDRVQFPTWTSYNSQDDIQPNWMTNTSARGSVNGDTYTYRVNITDHKNEYGNYNTHIYVYDKQGNYTAVAAPQTYINPKVTKGNDGWTYAPVVPTYVNSNQYIIEGLKKEEKTATTSPGSDWKNEGLVKTEYVNDGGTYRSDNKLTTSKTRVQVGFYYFHWCGPTEGTYSNYEKTNKFNHRDEISTNMTVFKRGTDNGHEYVYLYWPGTTNLGKCIHECCGDSSHTSPRSYAWYIGYIYQNKKEVKYYKFTRTTSWSSDLNNTTQIRFKLKSTSTPKNSSSQTNKSTTVNKAPSTNKPASLKIGNIKIKKLSTKKKKLTLSWNKASNAKTYKIAYKLKKSKSWKYKTTKKLSLVIKKLKSKKKYQIKVRGVNGKVNGNWSTIKTVKVK